MSDCFIVASFALKTEVSLISQATIDAVKAATDLPALVREYGVHLEKIANGWVGLCPFHVEKTASFNVTDRGEWKNHYHCFGCSTGGNAISFIMAIESWNFPRAVEYLADRAGIPIDKNHRAQNLYLAEIAKEDRELACFYWERHWKATRQALDRELAEGPPEPGTDDFEFCESLGRILRHIETCWTPQSLRWERDHIVGDAAWVTPKGLQLFRDQVTGRERTELKAERDYERRFTEAFLALAEHAHG